MFARSRGVAVKARFVHTDGLKKFEDIPGPKSLPVIGTLYHYLPIVGKYQFDRLHINGLKKLEQYGPVVREEITPGVNLVWIFKPEDIEIMFRIEGKHPSRRSHLALEKFRLDRPNVYNTGGLLPTNGPTWLKLRRIFQKGLSPKAVQQFIPATNDVIQSWLERVDAVQKIDKYDYLPELSRLYLELTCLVAFDIRLETFSKQELKPHSRSSKLINAALTTNSCILKTDHGPQLWRKFNTPLYYKLKKAQEYMESVAIDLLSLKMSIYNEHDQNYQPSLLETYLASPDLDFKDIIGIVCDLLLAGIDTTSYTTSFLLYYLAKNPGEQKALHEEAVRLLPNLDSPVTAEVLKEATYTKAVLKETHRLRPISVGIGRVLDTDGVFSNYHVPKGTVVVSQNQVSCRLEKYFTSPHEFKPERWIKSHPLYTQPHPFLLLPFGFGPRTCIARRLAEQHMQILILKLARNYKIGWNGSHIDSKSLLINKPDGPINLTFEKRSS